MTEATAKVSNPRVLFQQDRLEATMRRLNFSDNSLTMVPLVPSTRLRSDLCGSELSWLTFTLPALFSAHSVNRAVSCSAQLTSESLGATKSLCVRTSKSFSATTAEGHRVAGDDCHFNLALHHLVICGPAVPGSALFGGVRLAATVLSCTGTSVSLLTTTDNGNRGTGDGGGFDSALTFHGEIVLVVLADVALPRHRDIIFLQQDRSRCHAVLDIL